MKYKEISVRTKSRWIDSNWLFVVLFALLLMPVGSAAQESQSALDSIDGVYIPQDLDEAFHQINLLLTDSARIEIAAKSEVDFTASAHFGLGLWMRNNWKLWGDSRLATYLNNKGASHGDDMSGIILTSYHRQLTGEPIALKRQIKEARKYWRKSGKETSRYQRLDFRAFGIQDTVSYRFFDGFVSDVQKELYRRESCEARGVVVDANKTASQIRIRLIESCDPKGIIIEKPYQNISEGHDVALESVKLLKTGEEEWMHYSLWKVERPVF